MELIVVIVLVAIFAWVGSNLIGNFVGGYVDATERQELASAGRLAIERIAREIRRAIPNSILCPGGNCQDMDRFAFLRAAAGGRYVAVGPDQSRLQINDDGDQFVAFGLSSIQTDQDAVVYPQDAEPIYGSAADDDNPRSRLAAVADLSSGTVIKHRITLDGSDSFPRQSPARRVYAADRVTAFCCDAASGRLEMGTASLAALPEPIPSTPADFCDASNAGVQTHLLTDRVSDCSFGYDPATLNRSAIVRVFLELESTQAGETINWLHEVHVRNVP